MRLRCRPRVLLGLLLLAPLQGLAAQDAAAARWTVAIGLGPAFGGPSGELSSQFLAEGWTEEGCNTKGVDCHPNPISRNRVVHFSLAVSRRLSQRLEVQAIGGYGSLGEASGRKDGYDVTGKWSKTSFGAVLALKPVEALSLGAGPLLGMLNSQTPGKVPNSVVRGGLLFVSEARTSTKKETFLSVRASYHLLGKRHEGPWPARKGSWSGEQGPTAFDLDYSHFTISVGVGATW